MRRFWCIISLNAKDNRKYIGVEGGYHFYTDHPTHIRWWESEENAKRFLLHLPEDAIKHHWFVKDMEF